MDAAVGDAAVNPATPAEAKAAQQEPPPPSPSRMKFSMKDVATGMPTSTRFVGKLMKEAGTAAAAARRSAWRASGQRSTGSRDSVESPPHQGGSRKSPGAASGTAARQSDTLRKCAHTCDPPPNRFCCHRQKDGLARQQQRHGDLLRLEARRKIDTEEIRAGESEGCSGGGRLRASKRKRVGGEAIGKEESTILPEGEQRNLGW